MVTHASPKPCGVPREVGQTAKLFKHLNACVKQPIPSSSEPFVARTKWRHLHHFAFAATNGSKGGEGGEGSLYTGVQTLEKLSTLLPFWEHHWSPNFPAIHHATHPVLTQLHLMARKTSPTKGLAFSGMAPQLWNKSGQLLTSKTCAAVFLPPF